MFSLSPAAWLLWKTRTGTAMRPFQNQMVEQMGSPQSGHGGFWGC